MQRLLVRISVLSCCLFVSVIFSVLPNSGDVLAQEPLVIKIRGFREDKIVDATKEYKYQLLELILNKTKETDGQFRIEVVEHIVQSRVIEMVNQGDISLIITMTSQEREQKLLPIRIPVYKGFYGYRVFIINKQDKAKFEAIQTIEELKELWAGQGHDWPDLQILKANGFNVVGGASYKGLFGMLQKGRFDYFPRGVHEPWKEMQEHQEKDLMVEEHLVLQYPAPGYIFVARDNTKLADRLERGFRLVLEDGSFDQFFFSHPDIAKVLASAHLKGRLIFRLTNPLLSPETPLDQEELWYKP